MSGTSANFFYMLIGIIYLFESSSPSSSANTPQAHPSTPHVETETPAEKGKVTSQITRITMSSTQKSEINLVTNSSEGNSVPDIYSAAFDASRSNPQNLSLETTPAKSLILKDFTFRETAGFVAIGFLIFAMLGYIGFVSWRRYLQKKYENGQTLITEEVYDVSDLRNFEI